MNRIILYLLIAVVFYSCSKDEEVINNAELTGKWKLIEQYLDPGDGSGDFQSVNSKRTIEFFTNGDVISNGSLCSMSSDTGENSLGVFNKDLKTISSKNECNSSQYKIDYKLKDGKLQLWYPCIEGCAQKFKKIGN